MLIQEKKCHRNKDSHPSSIIKTDEFFKQI